MKTNCKLIFLLSVIAINNIFAVDFISVDQERYSYIYSPGMNSTEIQLVKYLPKFIASTGEKVSCNKYIHVVQKPVSTCKFPEVILKPLDRIKLFDNPFKSLFFYCRNLQYKKFNVKIRNTKDSKLKYSIATQSIDISKINIGQDADIECLNKTYKLHKEKYPELPIIMYGASRGAATTFNFIAQYQPKEVKAVVLEGVFDSVEHIIKRSFSRIEKIVTKILPKLTSYSPRGPKPIKNLSKYSYDIPTLIVTSKKDMLVPYQCSINLYCSLCNKGHKNIYLLILNNSSHPGYMYEDKQDKHDYLTVVHAFYKHHGLPHNPKLARKGNKKWLKCHPDPETLDNLRF